MSTATAPRITARIDQDDLELLKKAAALVGMTTVNAFVRSVSLERAKDIVEKEQILNLSQKDAILLAEELDREPVVNERLRLAAERYEGKTQQ